MEREIVVKIPVGLLSLSRDEAIEIFYDLGDQLGLTYVAAEDDRPEFDDLRYRKEAVGV